MQKEIATFANGCFWCTEAIFKELRGVETVVSGYSGGNIKNPTYEQICTGDTGHAETIQISFDPSVISYNDLLKVFFLTHDPTTLNRQGNDIGSQYRSAIFYHNDTQKQIAEKVKEEIEKEKVYQNPIVTEIKPFTNFYEAENYHKNYYEKNPDKPYCQFVINPKLQKFRKEFINLLKK